MLTVVSSTQINLTWTASTDNVAVTGYLVERCAGAGCTDFAQVGTPATDQLQRHRPDASTSYSYRVRATDAANNSSAYSATATATTQAPPDTQPPTAPGTPVLTRRLEHADQSDVDRGHRQRRRHRLFRRALRGRRLHDIRAGRSPATDQLQRHRPDGVDQLQLSRARDRRGEQPERVLRRRDRHHAGAAGHAAADRTRHAAC